jgi:hypothetical protein
MEMEPTLVMSISGTFRILKKGKCGGSVADDTMYVLLGLFGFRYH